MISEFEIRRLDALNQIGIIDTLPEKPFDDIVQLARSICDTPISLISFVGERRQWFKAKIGTKWSGTSREISFCEHTIQQDGIYIVHDASQHPEFRNNPMVLAEPYIRFYAGAVIKDSYGLPLGALCVIDKTPRELRNDQLESLECLAQLVKCLLEQKRLQKDLEEAERRANLSERRVRSAARNLESFIETAPIALCLLEGPEHRFIRINDFYSALVGRREVMGRTVAEAFPDLVGQPFPAYLDEVYRTGRAIQGKRVPIHMEPNAVGGGPMFVDFTYAPRFDESGEVCGIGVVAVDVTDESRAHQTLLDQERFITSITDNIPAQIAYVDDEWRLQFANRMLRDFLCIETEPCLGQPIESLMPAEQFAQRKKYFQKALQGEAQTSVFRAQTPGDHETVIMSREVPDLGHDGRVHGFYVVAYDQTAEEKLKEELLTARAEAEAANSAKSAFLANMSHEIRSPLSSIMGFASLSLESPETSEELKRNLGIIQRSSVQVLKIVDDILDLSKVEAGKMRMEHIPFSLVELLQDFASTMVLKAADKGLHFHMHAETSLPDRIVSDPTRLRQILTNAVGNALKFTQKGRVTLQISCHRDTLECRVIDTGIGISRQQARGLFEAFHQADISTTRKFGGTGLGLVLSKRMAEALGGDFVLEKSTPEKGSTFLATVRLEKAEGYRLIGSDSFNERLASSETLHRNPVSLNNRRILVVDDSPDNLLLVSRILKQSGARVETAHDGVEGVEKALQLSYDLILMDVQMPRMDGYEAVRRLRLKGITIPIIAITAHAMCDERDHCLKVGYSDYLPKPVDKEKLLNLAQSLLLDETG